VEYRNPQVPEGINVSATHPLLDFLRLLGGLAVIAAVVIAAAVFLADRLAKYIPFQAEQEFASQFSGKLPAPGVVSTYLQQLATRLASAQGLPPGMGVTVHFVDEPTVNAFATLGGNIVVFRGLLARMPSENALAMVLGHEIAHVKLRHPVSTMGRGLAIGVAVATISSGAGNDIAGRTIGHAGLLTAMTFSRAQERAADEEALRALAQVYGHVAHADEVFRLLAEEAAKLPVDPPAFLRTHPLDRERIDAIAQAAQANHWPTTGSLLALPDDVRKLISTPGP